MRTAALWFYASTLISSVGSFTFNICLVAFMVKQGYDLFHISLILGTQRLVPLFISGLLGHYTDTISAKMTVVAGEIGAALATFGILWAWEQGGPAYWYLVAFTLLKTSVFSFQAGSKSKITKILSGPSYASNASHAIYRGLFDSSPNLRCELKSRIVLDTAVIDEEHVTGAARYPNGLHAVAIYGFREGLIDRVWFPR